MRPDSATRAQFAALNIQKQWVSLERFEVLFSEFIPTSADSNTLSVQYAAIPKAKCHCHVSLLRRSGFATVECLTPFRYYTISVILATVGLAYGSVPLYKMVCTVKLLH